MAKIAYQEVATTNEAWWELNSAEDYTGAVRATETLTLFPQNVMVADSSGNIYYQRTGRVPRRPEGFDWSRPVDGSTLGDASGRASTRPPITFRCSTRRRDTCRTATSRPMP